MNLERRRRSTLDTADTVLGVVVAVIGVMIALWVVSWMIGTIFTLVKLAFFGLVIVGIIGLIARFKK